MANIMQMGDEPKYLGSWDLYELPNQKIQVTIKAIREESVEDTKGQKKKKAVMYFVEAVKPMILNIENKKRLSKLFFTKDSDAFIGKRIEIGYEKVKAFGDIHDALRVVPRLLPQSKTYTAPKCESCGGEIQPRGNNSAEQIAAYTKKKYGQALCSTCATRMATELRAAVQEAPNETVDE